MSFKQDYLSYLKIDKPFLYESVPCELCGSDDFLLIREFVSFGGKNIGRLPVQCCNKCGYLMQNPRFERAFYQYYYGEYYRKVTNSFVNPTEEFVQNQIYRGQNLKEFIDDYLPEPGKILDVGSSVGAMLIPFKNAGWAIYGVDPDHRFVQYGREKLNLDVDAADAESMKLKNGDYDLIIIMGSLEHVYDVNRVLELCRKAAKPGGYLLLEGRFRPLSHSTRYLNHNHHRYLREETIGFLMQKHGFEPILTTDKMICGEDSGREGNGYCLGKASDVPSEAEFQKMVEARRDLGIAQQILTELNEWDRKLEDSL